MSNPISEADITAQMAQMLPPAEELATYTPVQFVNLMTAARERVIASDAPGTVKYDPVTKAVAHRVFWDGSYKWRVSSADGTLGYNDQPTLDNWTDITPKDSQPSDPEATP